LLLFIKKECIIYRQYVGLKQIGVVEVKNNHAYTFHGSAESPKGSQFTGLQIENYSRLLVIEPRHKTGGAAFLIAILFPVFIKEE
jgi:hypothetical protein